MAKNLESGGQPWLPVVERGELAIVFLRHGRTSWNAERRFLGTTDISLDSLGMEQALSAAPAYRGMFSHVYSSPLSRALETARTIEDKPTLVNDFGELRQGALEGLTAVEAIEGFPEFFEHWAVNPADAQVPGGETLGECSTRARHALTAICAKHSVGEAVLVVSHQMVMAALTCHATGRGLNSWRECCVDNVAATVLSWNGLSLGLEIAGWRPGDAPS